MPLFVKVTDHLIKIEFHDKMSQEPKLKCVVNTGPRVNKPVWDNAKRVNHQKNSNKLKYPHLRKTFVPSGVLTKTGLTIPVKQNEKRAVHTVSTARPIQTSLLFVQQSIDLLQDQAMWIWFFCSSHMTGNKAYLSDYEDFNKGFMAFGSDPKGGKITSKGKIKTANLDFDDFKLLDESQVVLRAPRKDDVYNLDLKNIVPFRAEMVVAERKNMTLIEAARTMLADSLLPIPFWAEAVKSTCNVPIVKSLEAYNKRTKRVEENLHINFLEDQPNVTGTGPNWMFDLDFLTNSMNYIPVSVENQVNVDAGTQDSYVAGSSGKDKGPTQEYILLPLQPHRTRILVEDVPPAAHEKPSESSPKDNDVQDSEDTANKESEQDLQAFEKEKRRIASQKKAAQATSTNKLSTDRPSVSTDRQSVSTDRPFVNSDRSKTPYVSAASTPTGANAGESSFVYLGGKIPIDASTLPNVDLPIDPNMHDLEDASDTLTNEGNIQ
ncbi:hypothetical protein Tco_0730153 [Tanacetum coccineum]|uniref:Uncharacterized protein n=1 Tax=Tanacetum coccineum TaxID=301880 RepID=A0ABQ4YTQ6_9ASTR